MKKIFSFLLPALFLAGFVMLLPSCKKCKTCTFTTVTRCAQCKVGGFDLPEVCEANNQSNYDNAKSLCATANGTWTITKTDTTRVAEDICANNKADLVDKSIDLRLKGYICVDK